MRMCAVHRRVCTYMLYLECMYLCVYLCALECMDTRECIWTVGIYVNLSIVRTHA